MTELSNYSPFEAYRSTMTSINVKELYFEFQELYFEFQELTPLNGEPALNTLQKMLTQLKANASSVPTNLVRGRHSFIGVILSTVSYVSLAPLTSTQCPTHPGTLTFPPNLMQYAIVLSKTQHDDVMRSYHLYLLVKCALIHQVLDDIESKYLNRLRNRLTVQVPNDM